MPSQILRISCQSVAQIGIAVKFVIIFHPLFAYIIWLIIKEIVAQDRHVGLDQLQSY